MMAARFVQICSVIVGLPTMALAASYVPGVAGDFSYSNAFDQNGRFGQPITSGNDLFFPFASFSASADSANSTVSSSDTLSIDLLADPGLRFDAIGFIFTGTQNISGTPGSNTVQSDGSLTVTGLTGDQFAGFDSYTFMNDQSVQGGSWADSLSVLIPLGTQVTELNVSLSQSLFAIATDGSAQITATSEVVSGISLSVIPEPASVSLLAIGSMALIRRRRFC